MKKKILLIDPEIDGHHLPYIKAVLAAKDEYDFSLACPEFDNKLGIENHQTNKYNFKSFSNYRKWLKEIRKIIKEVKPDVVHLLFGDVLYRYFGYGVNRIRKLSKIFIASFHQLKPQKIAVISEKFLFKKITKVIVTTEYNYQTLIDQGFKNIELHEIPHLYTFPVIDKNEARKEYNLSKEVKVFGCIGIMSEYKRIDLLLDAFKEIKDENFYLIVAGRPEAYSEEFILEKSKEYKDKILCVARYLEEKEFLSLLNSCDYVIAPYSLNFNGMSGPLTEAVWARKHVISSDLRSLGMTVKNNDLGYVFECDNLSSLVDTLKLSLVDNKEWSDKAEEYRHKISIEYFSEKLKKIYENATK